MANLNIAIQIAAQDRGATGVIGRIKSAIGGLATSAKSSFGGLGGIVKTGLLGATTVAGGGLLALGAGLVKAGAEGLSFNSSMEMVQAQLNAFTKDGKKTADILEMIKTRAAKTPFEFEAMAQAATSLLPAAKASGEGLEGLIEQAEILAASNPAEGLEGAAFALKEALSGDFLSLVERFNLPKQFINDLKEQGVPNLEIVKRAMGELGLDTSLVTNLAETASGRWSTFLDTLKGLAAQVTQPIFTAFSSGLGQVNEYLSANEPLLTAMATTLADKVTGAVTWIVQSGIPMLQQFAGWFMTTGWPMIQPFINLVSMLLVGAIVFLGNNLNWLLPLLGVVAGAIVLISSPVTAVIGVITALGLAWSNNWLGIQTITSQALAFLQPYFDQLKVILNQFIVEVLPPLQLAWQTLVGVWRSELQPALSELWGAFGELFTEIFGGGPKVDVLKVALGLLKLALDGVVFWVRVLTPAIRVMGSGIEAGVDKVRSFVEMLTSLKRAAESILDPLRAVADRIQEMIQSALEMPDWMIPGSPTPFELGLRGIGKAIKQLPEMKLDLGARGSNPAASGLTGTGGGGPLSGLTLPRGGGGNVFNITIQANSKKEGEAAAGGFTDALRSKGLPVAL